MSRIKNVNSLIVIFIFACLYATNPAFADQSTSPRLMLWATESIGITNGDKCGISVETAQNAKLPTEPPTLTEKDIASWNPDNGRMRLASDHATTKKIMKLLRDHCFILALNGRIVERGIALDPESARMTGLATLTIYRDKNAPYLQITSGNHGFNSQVIHSTAIDAVLGNRANLQQ